MKTAKELVYICQKAEEDATTAFEQQFGGLCEVLTDVMFAQKTTSKFFSLTELENFTKKFNISVEYAMLAADLGPILRKNGYDVKAVYDTTYRWFGIVKKANFSGIKIYVPQI